MKRRIVLRTAAAKEFEDSIAFYEQRQAGLGLKFRAIIEQYFQRIVHNPEWFPQVRGEVRRAVVRRFPFVIHFLMETDRIVILSVFHTSQEPGQLKYRQ